MAYARDSAANAADAWGLEMASPAAIANVKSYII